MARRSGKVTGIEGPHPFAFLSAWREQSGLTQADVATHFDVTDVTIHRWETGKAPVTVQNFVLLARLYHAESPGHLLFPPSLAREASSLRETRDIIAGLSPEDLARWLDLGRALAGKTPSVTNKSEAA